MRTIRIPAIDWSEVQGVRAVVPVKVGWPELQLTLDQIAANAVAMVNGQELPFPDRSLICVEVERPRAC